MYHFTSIEYNPALPKTSSFGKNNAFLTSIDVKWSQNPSFTSSLAVVVYLKRYGMVCTAVRLPHSTWNGTREHVHTRARSQSLPQTQWNNTCCSRHISRYKNRPEVKDTLTWKILVGSQGFEPWTLGLRVPLPCQLSYAHHVQPQTQRDGRQPKPNLKCGEAACTSTGVGPGSHGFIRCNGRGTPLCVLGLAYP